MGFYAFPFPCLHISSPLSFRQLKVQAVLGNFISAILGLLFAVVGTLSGLITGAAIGQELGCGYFRGAAVGAVSGALLSVEVIEDFNRLWESNERGIQYLRYLSGVLVSLANGRLLWERVGTLFVFNSQPIQMATTEAISEGISEIGKCKGLLADVAEKIPAIEITSKNHADPWGENISCAVCLQDLQLGEKVRKLPYCDHMFHATCIDQWFRRCGCCPLCRRDV